MGTWDSMKEDIEKSIKEGEEAIKRTDTYFACKTNKIEKEVKQ